MIIKEWFDCSHLESGTLELPHQLLSNSTTNSFTIFCCLFWRSGQLPRPASLCGSPSLFPPLYEKSSPLKFARDSTLRHELRIWESGDDYLLNFGLLCFKQSNLDGGPGKPQRVLYVPIPLANHGTYCLGRNKHLQHLLVWSLHKREVGSSIVNTKEWWWGCTRLGWKRPKQPGWDQVLGESLGSWWAHWSHGFPKCFSWSLVQTFTRTS